MDSTRILNLDRVAFACDQRVVPVALGRTLVLAGMIVLAVGAWPPLNSQVAAQGIVVAAAGWMALVSFRRPRGRTTGVIAGIVGLLLAILFLIDALLSVSSQAAVTSPIDVDRSLREGLAALNSAYHEEMGWIIARTIAALLVALLSIEIGIAGVSFLTLNRCELRLLRDSRLSLSAALAGDLLDLPPGLSRYFRGSLWPRLGLLISTALFSISTFNIAGAHIYQNLGTIWYVASCVDAHVMLEPCIRESGRIAAVRMTILAVGSLTILPWIATAFWRRSCRATVVNAEVESEKDERPPIVFLRPFDDGQGGDGVSRDQVKLPKRRFTPMRFALTASAPSLALDHLLVEQFMNVAPPRAFPDDSMSGTRPFGALRGRRGNELVETGDAPEWRDEVSALCQRARLIVAVFDESIFRPDDDGLRWELRQLGAIPALKHKTIFICHPTLIHGGRGGRAGAALDRNKAVWQRAGVLAGFTPPQTSQPLLSLMIAADGTVHATSARCGDATCVTLALRDALNRCEC